MIIGLESKLKIRGIHVDTHYATSAAIDDALRTTTYNASYDVIMEAANTATMRATHAGRATTIFEVPLANQKMKG